MNLKETLTNPWVIGGGALIGVLILISSRGGGAGPSDNAGALYGYAANMTALSVDYGKTQLATNAALSIAAMQTYTALKSGEDKRAVDLATVSAGVTQTQIAAHTSIVLDRLNTFTARALAVTEAGRDYNLAKLSVVGKLKLAQMASDLQTHLANIQASTVKQQGILDFIGGIIPQF